MNKISEMFKKLGFTFSFKRLRKAIILVTVFTIIGIVVGVIYKFGSSEAGLRIVYEKEISKMMDLEGNTVIRAYKTDVNSDKVSDFVFITGKEKRSSEDVLNSTIELYNNVIFYIIDGDTKQIAKYDTKMNFNSDVRLRISVDEKAKYYLINDSMGNVKLLKLNEKDIVDMQNAVIDLTNNTTNGEFLGYTIYTSKKADNQNILKVTLDNYNKSYLKEYTKEIELDFNEANVDLAKYRETYLRDKISSFEFVDVDNDGILELVTSQYILCSLEDKTNIGKVEITFTIDENKLVYKSVEVKI